MEIKYCMKCNVPIEGRSDKKFCSHYCKTEFHNKKNHENDKKFKEIDRQLKKNRSILKRLNPAEKNTVAKEMLVESGFNFKYFTHYYKTENSKVYFFCYEFGYRDLKKDGKYCLVKQET
ncbi:MAG: hypothetical protein K8S00_05895 [Bacteroidales bacterium]|nr:hypothetical protein [Bacteroidales bacterium]